MSSRLPFLLPVLGLALGACSPAASPPPAAYELALVSLDGERQALGRLPGTVFAPRLSREGRHVVFDDHAAGMPRLYVAALDDLAGRQLLPSLDGGNAFPLWSFDDEQIFSIATRNGGQALFAQLGDGTGSHELIVSPASAPEAWTPDGRYLSFSTVDGVDNDDDNSASAISTWDRYDRVVTPLIQRDSPLRHSSHYSPDGRWVVYASNETELFEVWVQPVPSTGERHQVTRGGGEHPLWSPDGTRILFDRAGELFSVRITTNGGRFAAAEPETLPIKGFAQQAGARRQFDIAPDGRLLMLFPVD